MMLLIIVLARIHSSYLIKREKKERELGYFRCPIENEECKIGIDLMLIEM